MHVSPSLRSQAGPRGELECWEAFAIDRALSLASASTSFTLGTVEELES